MLPGCALRSGVLVVLLVSPLAAFADTKAMFTLPSGVDVEIIEAPFDAMRFRVSGCTEASALCLIDGRLPFGRAGVLPKTYVKRISVSYRGKAYTLNTQDMYDAWGNRPLEVTGTIRYFGGRCVDQKNCEFRGVFSDASGTFVAEWQVVDGLSIRTVLTGDAEIVRLFIENIDPPDVR